MISTDLHASPFFVLGVTVRDDRREITAQAADKLLDFDPDVCQQARADLLNPRTRAAAEVAWLPGVSPNRAKDLVGRVRSDPQSIWTETGLPALAHANLLSAAFQNLSVTDPSDLSNKILQLARIVEQVAIEDVLRDINEDRAVAGFPAVQGTGLLDEHIQERKRHFGGTVAAAVDRLSPTDLIEAVTMVVEYATSNGQFHAPDLVVALVDRYRIETQDFLQKEAANVEALVAAVRRAAASEETVVDSLIDKLAAVTRNWDRVAQPIQLTFMASGQRHPASNDLAYAIRNLAVDLCNDHDMLSQSKRLTDLLKSVFAEVPEVAEILEHDTEALEGLTTYRRDAEARRAEWARSITYRAEIGAVFKKTLNISPDGLSWDGRTYTLDSITRVRWGGIRRSVNGIPTGTTYTIAFGDRRSEAVVETRRKEVFSDVIQRLFQSVGIRLITELLHALKKEQLTFGEATVLDAGVILPRRRFLKATEKVRCSWDDVHVWVADGSFHIGAKADKKVVAGLSYIHVPNVHLLEHAIRMAFERGLSKLSDLLEGD